MSDGGIIKHCGNCANNISRTAVVDCVGEGVPDCPASGYFKWDPRKSVKQKIAPKPQDKNDRRSLLEWLHSR